ncbi:MAG TPA: inositol monophosphatase family protein, partial [Candidatus Micrarchaeota archaeon]|nr:inositol monophosphatase family protein [Candidatus Micrarchaeota archaeon]
MGTISSFTRQLALDAGRLALSKKYRLRFRRKKAFHDFVTEADLAVERMAVGKIKKSFPTHSIYSEEAGGIAGASKGDLWVLDPIDGTNNYSFGLPFWGVSIAYAKGGVVQSGAISLPELELLFHAQRGKGAYCNGKRIHVSKAAKLTDALVLFESRLARAQDKRKIRVLFDASKKGFGVRVLGTAVFNLCYVANGSAGASVMSGLKVVDFAAGALIAEEAGGTVTYFSGRPWTLKTADFIISNGKIHHELFKLAG